MGCCTSEEALAAEQQSPLDETVDNKRYQQVAVLAAIHPNEDNKLNQDDARHQLESPPKYSRQAFSRIDENGGQVMGIESPPQLEPSPMDGELSLEYDMDDMSEFATMQSRAEKSRKITALDPPSEDPWIQPNSTSEDRSYNDIDEEDSKEEKEQALEENRKKEIMYALKSGTRFNKINKMGRVQTRVVWLSTDDTKLCWGKKKNQKKPRGFLYVKDIQAVRAGCKGTKQQALAFTVVTSKRDLYLEADGLSLRDIWIEGLNMLIQ